MSDPEHAFVFTDNHDNQRGHGGGGDFLVIYILPYFSNPDIEENRYTRELILNLAYLCSSIVVCCGYFLCFCASSFFIIYYIIHSNPGCIWYVYLLPLIHLQVKRKKPL
jgi:hypothetical protein